MRGKKKQYKNLFFILLLKFFIKMRLYTINNFLVCLINKI